jgi:hypothetical protein
MTRVRKGGARDDKGVWVCGEKKNGQNLCFTLHSSNFTLKVSSLGSFGPAGLPPCLGQDSPRSPALLAFLETNTEAHTVVAVTGGGAVAPS